MGIGRLELLHHIEQTGSINQAAKAMKMSYKRAWDLIQSLNQLGGQPLVETKTGGPKGGGAVLTVAGITYLRQYETVRDHFLHFLVQESHLLLAPDTLISNQ